ncbi:hypothetical protein SAMN05444161_6925 [Rhizobiales bacterium GAS191]|nr:hypothetical protein SAMN05519103_06241 [Rhizobiales bacterium GAS113]SEE73739.1 hypothetical protein SAMN05444161_6925 [Rhizobiales bacterium GAS191]
MGSVTDAYSHSGVAFVTKNTRNFVENLNLVPSALSSPTCRRFTTISSRESLPQILNPAKGHVARRAISQKADQVSITSALSNCVLFVYNRPIVR